MTAIAQTAPQCGEPEVETADEAFALLPGHPLLILCLAGVQAVGGHPARAEAVLADAVSRAPA